MENKKSLLRNVAIAAILFVGVPLLIGMGVWLFADRKYNIISMLIALVSCVPFFIRFERGKNGARELVVIAVMTAFSVFGRLVFAPLPGFKPVTAMTVIAGIALGPETGFLVGSFTAIVSNIFFGQGPWTPFQMFVWGIIGFVSGLIFYKRQDPNRVVMSLVGVLGGALYSVLMDVWTTLSLDGGFSLARYIATVATSLPFMAMYSVSNVVFLLVLSKPFLEKLNRLKRKYGIFNPKGKLN